MQIAVSNIAWRPDEAPEVLAQLAGLGITGLELAPTLAFPGFPAVSQAQAREQRARWADQGFAVVAFQALLFGHPEFQVFDPATHPAFLAHLARVAELAGWLGAGPLVFGSPKNRLRGELPWEAALEQAAGFFRRAAALAWDHGAALCLEPNAPGYGADFLTDTGETVALAARVDHPGCGVNLDAGVLTMNGEDYDAAVDLALARMRHCHASEPFLNRVSLGPGGPEHTDHPRLAVALRKHGYQGWVSLEMRSDPDGPNPRAVAAAASQVLATYGD
ncbi:MAG: sugar phosphate isomerase/epimerase [Deltaproteobacteria bacterium]|nr:sugar phosphate isomerase/epimerase [Deltaproteobacteria bacterium]